MKKDQLLIIFNLGIVNEFLTVGICRTSNCLILYTLLVYYCNESAIVSHDVKIISDFIRK